jgi:hypothetical protein
LAQPLGIIILDGVDHHLVEIVITILETPSLKINHQTHLLYIGVHPAGVRNSTVTGTH